MPYGMLPVLEIDGKPIAQSNAVARYLARKHNLAGKDEWESMLCDVLVDTLGDLKQCKCYICLVQSTINDYRKAAYNLPLSTSASNRYSFSESASGRDFPFLRRISPKVSNRSHRAI